MSTGIMFQRRVRVTKRGYLLEIPRQKGSDRTSLLILVHVAKLVGGTLMQILLPATLAFHFWQYHSRLGIQVSLLWLGQNFLNISVYAADARVQGLDLLGGRTHDWSYLLDRLGLLEYDLVFAFFFCFLALMTFMALLALPFYMEVDQ